MMKRMEASRETDTRRGRAPKVIAVVVGAMFVVFGVWALLAPQSFFDAVASFEPYNPHFVRDLGAFQIGLGAVLLVGAFLHDALLTVLSGVAVGATLHLITHIADRDLGGSPATDIPFFALMALALIGGALSRAGALSRRSR
jgi:hypothetical protein